MIQVTSDPLYHHDRHDHHDYHDHHANDDHQAGNDDDDKIWLQSRNDAPAVGHDLWLRRRRVDVIIIIGDDHHNW